MTLKNGLILKFKAFVEYIDKEAERAKIEPRQMEKLAPLEYQRYWSFIRAAEQAYRENSLHGVDTNLIKARKEFLAGISVVNKRVKDDAKKGIYHEAHAAAL